uniref:Uncharacterized protein n=1 Tax=Solanum tuberosum TaxID=4113 RepID=M1DAB7_SOLTU
MEDHSAQLVLRYARRSTFWSISSPFYFILQPLRLLSCWVIWNCFAELLDDTPTAPFHHQLDLSLQGSVHWNERRSPGRSATRQLSSAITLISFLHSFHPPYSFLPSSVHALPQTPNTLNLMICIRY